MKKYRLTPILKQFKIHPKNYNLYEEAFTHPSMNVNNNEIVNYQRLEFVGDSVLSAVIASISYKCRQDLQEGALTRLRSSLVDTESLSKLALGYHFDEYILVGASFNKPVKEFPKILEDVFEAFIGAAYLDLGFSFTYRLIDRIFHQGIIAFNYEESIDYKTKIQELIQSDKHTDLNYRLLNKKGPMNAPTFAIGLYYDGVLLGKGYGHSKKAAEQEAAKIALDKLAKKA